MKIALFKDKSGQVGGGVLSGATIRRFPKNGPDDVLAFIESGGASPLGDEVYAKDVTLLVPLHRPPRIFDIGLNYRVHAAE